MTPVPRAFRLQWKAFKEAPPGQRFAQHYRRSRNAREKGSAWARPLRWLLALVCFAIGVVLVFIPGPAILFFAVAGLLAASDSQAVARALDRLEIELWRLFSWGHRRWNSMEWPGRIAICVLVAVLAAAALVGMWWFWQNRREGGFLRF